MNSNPHHQPSLVNSHWIDWSSSAQSNSPQLVMEAERLQELRRQVAAQEQRLHSLRQQAADASNSPIPSTAEQGVMKSLIFTKEKELAMALMKVAELTSQLEHLRRTRVDDSKPSQKMLETDSQPKAIVQKIIPIKLIRGDVRLANDAKKLSEKETKFEPTSEANRGVRIIPIVVERTVQTSRSTASSAVQPQCVSSERAFASHRSPTQTGENLSAFQKENDKIRASTEARSGTGSTDVNENVKSRGKIFTDLTTDIRNTSTSDSVVDGSSKPHDSSSERVAVERVYVEKVGKAQFNCGKAKNDRINISRFDNERSIEHKYVDASDFEKRVDARDRAVESRDALVKEDEIKRVDATSKSSVGDTNDRGVLVKDKKNAVNRSHSMGDKTRGDERLLGEQKEHFIKISNIKADDPNSSNAYPNRDEDYRANVFSQDKKSFSDFSLSDQLVEPSKVGSKGSSVDAAAAGWSGKTADTCGNGISENAHCERSNGSSRTTESGFKSDRARFFMDMVKENENETGTRTVQTWMEMQRSPVFSEFRKPPSPVFSSATSRGRSSSSAIMSRFAPQPYGRSKSVDSGSLRVPMTTLRGAVHHERLPEVAAGDAENVSAITTSTSSRPNQHSVISSYGNGSYALKSPTVISESHIQMETTVSGSRATPNSLLFQKSISSDSPSYQKKTVSFRESCHQELVDAKSVSSPAGWSLCDSKQSSTETFPTRTTAVLLGDRVGYSMPLTSGPVNVLASLQTSSSSTKVSPSNPEFSSLSSSAVVDSSEMSSKTSNVDIKSPLQGSIVPIVGSTVWCGVVNSLNTMSSATSVDTKTILPSHGAKSPSTNVSSSSTNVGAKSPSTNVSSSSTNVPPDVINTLQQNTNSLPECRRCPVVSLIKSSCGTPSSVVKPQNCVPTPSSSSYKVKMDSLSRSAETRSEEVQVAEEMSNTSWDSNVKRLAHIYAVTISGRVPGRTSFHGDSSGESNFSRAGSAKTEVPPFSNGSNNVASRNTLKHSQAGQSSDELDSGTSLLGSVSSRFPYSQERLMSSGSNETTISAARHEQTTQCSNGVELSKSDVVDSAEQLKIDTSADSVSSALSVLLKSSSLAHNSPMRPSRLRTTISSAYRRKLGSGAMDNYSQNMTLLYGDSLVKNDNSTSSNIQERPEDATNSPPLQETPLIEDLPRILALDTLDGMPFYPRISHHLRDAQGSSVDIVNARIDQQESKRGDLLKSGEVELTIISSPKQMADLVHLDSVETKIESSNAFNPSDDIVSAYIDDPAAADGVRLSSKTKTQPHGRLFTGRDGRPRRRVTFDHVSLLLNAALEGEKDLVIDIINRSANPNQKTETGLSALHNAVCGNHADIVRYLVEFGCDINVADNDGWTPLHCAASTNNVEMLRILVETGASVLPMTISDRETPVQKCSRNLPGFEEAVKYLSDMAITLGVANDGWVYVTTNFTNVCSDELVLGAGERLKILRKGDQNESEWWWARKGDAEGYVPQSLLALYPSINPKWMK